MNRRHYQLIALSILIGAPLLVHVVTQYLPHPEVAAVETGAQNQAAPEVDPTAQAVAGLPKALPPPPTAQAQGPLRGGATLDTQPTLNVEGVAVAGTDPASPVQPAQPVQPAPVQVAAAAAPPPAPAAEPVAKPEPPSGNQPTVTYVSSMPGGARPLFREGLIRQPR